MPASSVFARRPGARLAGRQASRAADGVCILTAGHRLVLDEEHPGAADRGMDRRPPPPGWVSARTSELDAASSLPRGPWLPSSNTQPTQSFHAVLRGSAWGHDAGSSRAGCGPRAWRTGLSIRPDVNRTKTAAAYSAAEFERKIIEETGKCEHLLHIRRTRSDSKRLALFAA
jgi:hypothetical protein